MIQNVVTSHRKLVVRALWLLGIPLIAELVLGVGFIVVGREADGPRFLLDGLGVLGRVGRVRLAVVVDFVEAGIPVGQFMTAVGSSLAHLHCCDFSPNTNRRLYPGKGVFDFTRLKHQLMEHHYNGAVVLETHSADRDDDLLHDRRQMVIFDHTCAATVDWIKDAVIRPSH